MLVSLFRILEEVFALNCFLKPVASRRLRTPYFLGIIVFPFKNENTLEFRRFYGNIFNVSYAISDPSLQAY